MYRQKSYHDILKFTCILQVGTTMVDCWEGSTLKKLVIFKIPGNKFNPGFKCNPLLKFTPLQKILLVACQFAIRVPYRNGNAYLHKIKPYPINLENSTLYTWSRKALSIRWIFKLRVTSNKVRVTLLRRIPGTQLSLDYYPRLITRFAIVDRSQSIDPG